MLGTGQSACFALAAMAASLCLSMPVQAGGPAPAEQPSLQLGTISVTGQRDVINTLRSIKLALKTPYSDDAAHADDLVCRIDKQLGEAKEYLDCGINRDLTKRRDSTQTNIMITTLGVPGGTDLLRGFIAAQPEHHLRVPVNGAGLQTVLEQIPDAPPVAAAGTAVSPAAASSAPGKAPSR
ncbi:MAG TPA: hypothetical protein VGM47_01310 [Gammaproteobacteria bacterium]